MISVDEISKHIKIELLHPEWKTKKDEEKKRYSKTVFAEPSAISANLNRIARNRPDVFVSDEEKIEQDAIKKNPAHRRAVYSAKATTSAAAISFNNRQKRQRPQSPGPKEKEPAKKKKTKKKKKKTESY
eukprot:TRINITY_DN14103_c0_g2_i1.p1 TRINITY_DN14103_c0_g2~~TRINITY_DN14103_c0_g2_i1.p1  ORF type:complete len:145 (-),score=40.12 TRINITY_DN14103_c0_g2_i1:167-553(-)